jgi:hypothetical protein
VVATYSPLLSNVYLHYVLDQWRQAARGEITIVRYADHAILGFERQDEAERYLRELKVHLCEYGLELNEDKTRLIRFGRLAAFNRTERGEESRRRSPFWDSSIFAGGTVWAGSKSDALRTANEGGRNCKN